MINGGVREHPPVLDKLSTTADGLLTTDTETPPARCIQCRLRCWRAWASSCHH